MSQPAYQKPKYITYEMIERQLRVGAVKVVDDELANEGLYIGQVEDYMAQGESFILQTVLSNYVHLPLTTINGGTFADLQNNPEWEQLTYTPLVNLFKASALYQIYLNYYAVGGEGNNGEALIINQSKQVSFYTSMLLRLDQNGNMMYKNAFIGLKLRDNGNPKMPRRSRGAAGSMFDGQDQAYAAFNAIPNYRRTR